MGSKHHKERPRVGLASEPTTLETLSTEGDPPFLKDYVQELLSKEVILKVRSTRFHCWLFCVPEKDPEKKSHSGPTTPEQVHQVRQVPYAPCVTNSDTFTHGAVTVSIDLTDTYWHIPISCRFIPSLGFQLGNKKFAFRALPFGLNIVPRISTR